VSDPIERLEGELARLGGEHARLPARLGFVLAAEPRELARLGGEHEPKPGWQARVLAATAEATKPARRPWWQFAIPALVVAAATIVIVVGTRAPAKPEALVLAIAIDGGSAVARGASAKIGDVVRATASGGKFRAVWIYRGDNELVAACPGAVGCTETARSVTVEAMLRAPGNYIVVALDADAPLLPPTGTSYDTDVARAQRDGARKRTNTIEVR
jgi:hypothetical protein